ncbi:hypothetical protein FKR81_42245 [Lentzea tibetensis]|uniref:Uncharacterized protein n=1 Tax=Lentzea tibetensis TaxID=2591470 RepID=A0A563EET4_9PSEU|nr:hypothetical protein [Lentzea tibetensis]TWP43569.1 hypothetical protein FKR81_42245 [Lentzea tibetensis]
MICDASWARYVSVELATISSGMLSFGVDHHLDEGRHLSDVTTVVDLAVRQRPTGEAPQIA